MTRVLVTGGTGKTGSRVMQALRGNDIECIAASRRGGDQGSVRFDWFDAGTWETALRGITSAYLVAPTGAPYPEEVMVPFIERAIASGTSRFVLLSASLLERGDPGLGQVHAWLAESEVNWSVLRPSWFMDNFAEGRHLRDVREHSRIISATGSARVGFISSEDIARAAVALLSDPAAQSGDYILTGPEPISYGDVARTMSELIGRDIEHTSVPVEKLILELKEAGLPVQYARMLAGLDTLIASGAEDRATPCVEQLTGREPESFAAFAVRHAPLWLTVT
ncbi:MAG: ergot alkaloid biosynthesis protein [Pseudomonadales bacterium]|nr:ergot alkaloid biosynthesis protein [Pseudomonadales bacterium]